jgi:hypothetical protein
MSSSMRWCLSGLGMLAGCALPHPDPGPLPMSVALNPGLRAAAAGAGVRLQVLTEAEHAAF